MAANDKSLGNITAQVLKCKKEKWDYEEKRRRRETADLEEEVLMLLRKEKKEAVVLSGEEAEELTREWEEKLRRVREVFEKAREKEERRREVPDWAVDDITFGFMVDPVIVSAAPGQIGGFDWADKGHNRPKQASRTNELLFWST